MITWNLHMIEPNVPVAKKFGIVVSAVETGEAISNWRGNIGAYQWQQMAHTKNKAGFGSGLVAWQSGLTEQEAKFHLRDFKALVEINIS